MKFLWWLGYAGILVFVIMVLSRLFELVADEYGGQATWNIFMWLCIVWLMIRVERKRK